MLYVIGAIIAFVLGMRLVRKRDEDNQEFLDEQHGRGHHLRDTSWPVGPGPSGPTG
ncbi:MAG TPA: hypothetical protein VJ978_04355 [Nitriliruptoraceae bacterium]|nr:hypothetical protein [Nitriliruptoraceae bacterium]